MYLEGTRDAPVFKEKADETQKGKPKKLFRGFKHKHILVSNSACHNNVCSHKPAHINHFNLPTPILLIRILQIRTNPQPIIRRIIILKRIVQLDDPQWTYLIIRRGTARRHQLREMAHLGIRIIVVRDTSGSVIAFRAALLTVSDLRVSLVAKLGTAVEDEATIVAVAELNAGVGPTDGLRDVGTVYDLRGGLWSKGLVQVSSGQMGKDTGICAVDPMRQVHALESWVGAVLQEDANVGRAAWRISRVGVGTRSAVVLQVPFVRRDIRRVASSDSIPARPHRKHSFSNKSRRSTTYSLSYHNNPTKNPHS